MGDHATSGLSGRRGAFVVGADLVEDGAVLGTFSSHWAAVAAMIRLTDPDFRSLGEDRPEDLAVERAVVRAPGGGPTDE